MRRLAISLFVLSLAAAAFALGACGDDDDGNSSTQGGLTIQAAPPPAGDGEAADPAAEDPGATGESGGSKKSKKSKKSEESSGASGAEDIIDDTTAPPAKESGPGGNTKLNEDVAESFTKEGRDKISHDAARMVCAEEKLKDIRKIYNVKGSGDTAIAKAVSKAYRPKSRREAAYSGCLKGLADR